MFSTRTIIPNFITGARPRAGPVSPTMLSSSRGTYRVVAGQSGDNWRVCIESPGGTEWDRARTRRNSDGGREKRSAKEESVHAWFHKVVDRAQPGFSFGFGDCGHTVCLHGLEQYKKSVQRDILVSETGTCAQRRRLDGRNGTLSHTRWSQLCARPGSRQAVGGGGSGQGPDVTVLAGVRQRRLATRS